MSIYIIRRIRFLQIRLESFKKVPESYGVSTLFWEKFRGLRITSLRGSPPPIHRIIKYWFLVPHSSVPGVSQQTSQAGGTDGCTNHYISPLYIHRDSDTISDISLYLHYMYHLYIISLIYPDMVVSTHSKIGA